MVTLIMDYKVMVHNLLILLIYGFILNGCDLSTPDYPVIIADDEEEEILSIQFTPKPNLPIDTNGLYHLTLGMGVQTIHTLHGILHRGDDTTNGVNIIKMLWRSTLTWDWNGFIIPTINSSSYSREDGSVSQTIGVPHEHRGDTMVVFTAWFDNWKEEESEGEPFFIVID